MLYEVITLNERGRVQKGGRLKKHARGKSAQHHSGNDTMEEYRIARYSDQFFIDDMDIIDDRLMALPEVIDEMALAAAGVGLTLGFSAAEIKAGLENFKPVGGRMNIIQTRNNFV